ncbi:MULTISPECIES: hypothetical protein [Legionella]|uniref:DUF58 domain-containing protein n=1 Tax=Legionella septentrionalis TaxID=2498109 RepID=A0A3S0WSE4_9GAMM|nr:MULTISPECIES: hypothetical protein [Legionella]MCP0914462.1 hypothetical protein [Legionella sp. 27cVA30]RUQ89474.1 hypothetical protein EKM59_03490 [Legionella septentrionalis]RUR10486.1 hypothetical protein ELY14_05115 [Legionella septentrionalis]
MKYPTLRRLFLPWAKKRISAKNPQQLTTRTLYILPSAFGCGYGLVVLTIAIGAINYQLNLAFLLAFLLIVLGILGMWASHQNLKGLLVQCLPINDTEQGQPATINLLVKGENAVHFSLILQFPREESHYIENIPKEGLQITLPLSTAKRGVFFLPQIKIYSYAPLGIFRVWGYLNFQMEYYVYPKPISPGYWPEKNLDFPHGSAEQLGDEDLFELKPAANPWMQAGRIAWKISARSQGWYLKTMTSTVGENWMFRMQEASSTNVEKSLQQLSYWLQTAEEQGQSYGLEIKDTCTEISQGAHHLQYCLRLLAAY